MAWIFSFFFCWGWGGLGGGGCRVLNAARHLDVPTFLENCLLICHIGLYGFTQVIYLRPVIA